MPATDGWGNHIARLLEARIFSGGVSGEEAAAALKLPRDEARKLLETFSRTEPGRQFMRENHVTLSVIVTDSDIVLRPVTRMSTFSSREDYEEEAAS